MLVIPSGGSAVEEFLIKRQESRDVSASLDMTKGTGEYAKAPKAKRRSKTRPFAVASQLRA